MTSERLPSVLLEKAVGEFSKLPGVGRKTALRFVLHLLRQDKEQTTLLGQSLIRLRENVMYCKRCHNISDTEICGICANTQRDQTTICVVENVQGVLAIENTGQYKGLYHVLQGAISPMDGIGPAQLNIASLFDRLEAGGVKEVVMATNPNVEGETTALYLAQRIKPMGIKVTRIAHGVPVGGDLEYADEATLAQALYGRKEI